MRIGLDADVNLTEAPRRAHWMTLRGCFFWGGGSLWDIGCLLMLLGFLRGHWAPGVYWGYGVSVGVLGVYRVIGVVYGDIVGGGLCGEIGASVG